MTDPYEAVNTNDENVPRGVYDAARDYARQGLYVFPVLVKGRDAKGKKITEFPTRHGVKDSSRSLADIGAWEQDYPNAVIAIDTGRSNLVVVDCDGQNGIANWRALNPPEPLGIVDTAGGGEHWYYREDPRHVVGNDHYGKVADNVDIRGLGGLIFAPPSVDGAGGSWKWRNTPDWTADRVVPAVVVERMNAKKSPKAETPAVERTGDDLFDEPEHDNRYTREAAKERVNEAIQRFKAALTKAERLDSGRNGAINNFAMECAHFPWLVSEEQCGKIMLKRAQPITGWTELDRDDLATIRSAYKATAAGKSWVAIETKDSVNWRNASGEGDMTEGEKAERRAARLDRLKAKILTLDQLRELPPLRPLIKGVLNRESATWLIGQPGGFKSFVALDWACHVASGQEWRGRAVEQGDVLYVLGEGVRGFMKRIDAWTKHYGAKPDRLYVLPEPVKVKGDGNNPSTDWETLHEYVQELKPALIVFDTQARMTVGMEENSNTEMGIWVDAVEAMKRATEACVLVVHHTGRNGGDARGASAVDGAQDMEWRVDREADKRRMTLSCDKNKDDDDTARWTFDMDVIEVGRDQDDAPITSLVLGAMTSGQEERRPDVQVILAKDEALRIGNQQLVTRVLDELDIHRDGMTIAQLAAAVKDAQKRAKVPAAKQLDQRQVKSAVDRLRSNGTASRAGEKYLLTYERIEAPSFTNDLIEGEANSEVTSED